MDKKPVSESAVELEQLLADVRELRRAVRRYLGTITVKGGPGSGEHDGHPFRGNQHTGANGAGQDGKPEGEKFKIGDLTFNRIAVNIQNLSRDDAFGNSRIAKRATIAAEKIATTLEGHELSLSKLGPMDHILAMENSVHNPDAKAPIFDPSASIHPDVNAVSILSMSYGLLIHRLGVLALPGRTPAEVAALTDTLKAMGIKDAEISKFREAARSMEDSATGVESLAEKLVSPERFLKGVFDTVEQDRDAQFVHMTGSLNALVEMVKSGANSHHALVGSLSDELKGLQKLRDDVYEELDAIKSKISKMPDGDERDELVQKKLEISDKHENILDKIATIEKVTQGNTYASDINSGLDRFVFMSYEHTESGRYGDYGIVVNNSLIDDPMTWGTSKDIAMFGAFMDDGETEYNRATVENYRRMITNDGGFRAVAAAQKLLNRTIDLENSFSNIEAKASHVPPSKIDAVIVPGKFEGEKVRAAGFKGDIIRVNQDYGHPVVVFINDETKPILVLPKNTHTKSATTQAIRAYRERQRKNRKKTFAFEWLTKGGPGSGDKRINIQALTEPNQR